MKKRVGLWFFCCGVALAQERPHERLPVELRSCVSIERNTERLACFDRAAAAIMGAEGSAAPSTESSFGLVATTPKAASRGEAGEELRTLRGRVTALRTANGDELITLDNGQVWRQLSGGILLLKVGDEVEITRAALGSFQIKVPSGRSGKVKRIS
jgi:hypothetical protein